MSQLGYDRFALQAPDGIGQAHEAAIRVEIDRLARALEAGDASQALGYLKCLAEAVAKVTLDINGTPASMEDYPFVVQGAHRLLHPQRGDGLADEGAYAQMATQARKIVTNLAEIRNEYGAGHGRSREPELQPEMLDLALDAGLLWVRWALRRLTYFAQGRPEKLIRDLVGDPGGWIDFYKGDLTERLRLTNLPTLESQHVRSIGVAVGQRTARDTFNVRYEGVEACINEPDLKKWPEDYRIGVSVGLLYSPEEHPTFTARDLRLALQICIPVTGAAEEIVQLWERTRLVMQQRPRILLAEDPADLAEIPPLAIEIAQNRTEDEKSALLNFASTLQCWLDAPPD